MQEVGQLGPDIGDISKDPVEQVDKMGKLGEEDAAVERALAVPFVVLAVVEVITVVAVPESIDLNHQDLTEAPVLYDFLEPCSGWRVAVLHHAKYLAGDV